MNTYNETDQKLDTKQRILDAAEHLFAKNGFHVTSLRSITGKAGVNLAAVNYHFGSKEALLESVLERRIIPLNRVRRERLENVRDKARTEGKPPSVEDLLLAFLEPTLTFRDTTPGSDDFIALVSRSFSDPDDTVRKIFLRLVLPLFHLIFETFREAIPDIPENVLLWRLHFMFGAFSHIMHLCCSSFQSDIIRMPTDNDTKTIIDMFIPFITAGMEA